MSHSRPTCRGWHMATKPLQDDPSGPDTEYPQLEPVLVLRTAKSLILPLRVPMPLWEEQPFASAPPTRSSGASPVVAFTATTHVFDPGTQRTHTVTLSIGPGHDDGSANMFLQSESMERRELESASLPRNRAACRRSFCRSESGTSPWVVRRFLHSKTDTRQRTRLPLHGGSRALQSS